MATDHDYVDVEDDPRIIDLANRVNANGRTIEVRRAGKTIAVLKPMSFSQTEPGAITDEDREAFRRTAAAWNGIVDTDELEEWIAERRQMPPKPAVEL